MAALRRRNEDVGIARSGQFRKLGLNVDESSIEHLNDGVLRDRGHVALPPGGPGSRPSLRPCCVRGWIRNGAKDYGTVAAMDKSRGHSAFARCQLLVAPIEWVLARKVRTGAHHRTLFESEILESTKSAAGLSGWRFGSGKVVASANRFAGSTLPRSTQDLSSRLACGPHRNERTNSHRTARANAPVARYAWVGDAPVDPRQPSLNGGAAG